MELLLGRVPVRLYVWSVSEDFDDLEDAPQIDSWDKISYINRPVEIHGEEGKQLPIVRTICLESVNVVNLICCLFILCF